MGGIEKVLVIEDGTKEVRIYFIGHCHEIIDEIIKESYYSASKAMQTKIKEQLVHTTSSEAKSIDNKSEVVSKYMEILSNNNTLGKLTKDPMNHDLMDSAY